MKNLDYYLAVSMLEMAVEERGLTHVYTREPGSASCLYVHGTTAYDPDTETDQETDETDWEPGCLVGWVLYQIGVRLSVLKQHENKSAHQLFDALEKEGELEVDKAARSLLGDAQGYQDDKLPWGTAAIKALRSSASSMAFRVTEAQRILTK